MTTASWRHTYYLPEEVAGHNAPDDCWIVIYGVVKNVTRLIDEFSRTTDLVDPILEEAGQDVSYWFDTDMDGAPVLKTHLDPTTGARVSVLPFRIPHQPDFDPDVGWMAPEPEAIPWWQDERYNVGMETVGAIHVHVLNLFIKLTATIKVCLEDTVNRILERYAAYNEEIDSYAIEYIGRPLRKDWDLSQNGVLIVKRDGTIYDYVPTLTVYRHQHAKASCHDLRSLK